MYAADNDDITMGLCFNEVLLCIHMERGVAQTVRTGWVPYANYFLDFSGVQALCLNWAYFLSKFALSYFLMSSVH
jgi:hypothetical protein